MCADRQMLKRCGPTKENRQPTGKVAGGAAESNPDRELSADPQSGQQPGHDLLTSCYSAGSRSVALAALKQRSQNAPSRTEVTVQLLDQRPLHSSTVPLTTNSRGSVGPITRSQDALGVQTDASTAAAIAAAAVAATVPLIKAHSDMEARISQLADGVQTLLNADREGRPRGRSLSQQTLQHLEMLHSQQLQHQSKLLESDLRIVTGHAPVTVATSGPTVMSDCPATESGRYSRQCSSSAARAATVDPCPVAMATPHCGQWPEHTRDDRYHQRAPSVSTTTHPAKGSNLQASASHTQATAKRANDILKEMGRFKTEMKMLLRPEDEQKTTRPPATADSQIQQKHYQQTNSQHIMSKQSDFQGSLSQNIQVQQTQPQQSHPLSQQPEPQSQRIQSQQTQSQQNHNQLPQIQPQPQHSQQSETEQNQSQSQQTQFQAMQPQCPQDNKTESKHAQSKQSKSRLSQESHSVLSKGKPVISSTLEKASMVLRSVQRRRKILEENFEATLRAKNGALLHRQLEALAANRDVTEEVRIKKMVDACIKNITKDIQAELDSENTVKSKPADAATKTTKSRTPAVGRQHRADGSNRERPVNEARIAGSKATAVRGRREPTAKHGSQAAGRRLLREAEEAIPTVRGSELTDSDRELFLTRIYGRAPHEGQRRTLKKSPYLRFSSPASPRTKTPRPRLVESIRGVKVKSCKTQTSWAPPSPKGKPVWPLPGQPQPHHVFRSSHETSKDSNNLPETSCFPVAIPLGRPRVRSSHRFFLTEHPQEVPVPPTSPPSSNISPTEVGPTDLQPQRAEELDRREATPPLPPHVVKIAEMKSDEEEEAHLFPGSDLIFATNVDVIQEEVINVDAEPVELHGCPSPPPVVYQGPVFPPQARSALPAQEQAPVLDLVWQRETLETRLVEWVEQQVMSRMISELYRPLPTDPVQDSSTDQSELEEHSVTSDIDEAAGGGGPQLSGDVGVSVDSPLIRQLVNEVLAEMISTIMGPKETSETRPESRLGPSKPAHHEETLILTPVPTPSSSPCPPIRDTTPIATPSPSEPRSPLSEESHHPITVTEKVAMPTSSPEPIHSPGRSPTGIHPAPPSLPWEDTELPLAEERPEDNPDTRTQPFITDVWREAGWKRWWIAPPTVRTATSSIRKCVMSVAEEEPPLSSPPSTILPTQKQSSPPPPQAELRSPSSVQSTDDSSSSSSSTSITVTPRTDTATKHISEGEMLISVDQMAAMRGLTDAFIFSNTLQDMDYDDDEPSEGQVTRCNPQLTLQDQLGQGVNPRYRHARPQPEGSWGDEEEVTTDHRTTNTRNPAAFGGHDSSPGQINCCGVMADDGLVLTNASAVLSHWDGCFEQLYKADPPGMLDISSARFLVADSPVTCETFKDASLETTSQDSDTDSDLVMEPVRADVLMSPAALVHNTHTVGQVVPVTVRQNSRQSDGQEEQQEGTGAAEAHLPSIRPEEEQQEVIDDSDSVAGTSDIDSSVEDCF